MEHDNSELDAALVDSMRGLVSKPDLYLIKAAQASTLRQLKAARTLLRDHNAAAKQQLEQKLSASQAAVQHLTSIRQDLDYTYARIRELKQQLAEVHPELYKQLQQELAAEED